MNEAKEVKRLARAAGFPLVRITRALPLHGELARYLTWLEEGRHGEMRWMTSAHATFSADPRNALASARSVVCVAMPYRASGSPVPGQGRIARYAWGADYHAILGERLRCLAEALTRRFGGEHRWYVDTGPLMDKAIAARSGVGWYGKNSNILTERFGSFVLLGELLTTLTLDEDSPLDRDCGKCRLCEVACPTGAIGPDYSVDSRKCISYLTIEHRGPIPRDLRPLMGSWVFGCDICQEVCPPTMKVSLAPANYRLWARSLRSQTGRRANEEAMDVELTDDKSPLGREGVGPSIDLTWLLALTHAEYVEAFRGTSLRRAKVWMLRRNAAVALGNMGQEEALAPLKTALLSDEHPIVRGHAAWALGELARRHQLASVVSILERALQGEADAYVCDEILEALSVVRPAGVCGRTSIAE